MTYRRLLFILPFLVLLISCNRDPEVVKHRLLTVGNKYFDKGQYREASIIYRKALQVDRRYGEAYYRLGLTELKLGRIADAFRALQRANELQPENPDAYANLADVYLLILSDPSAPPQYLRDLNELTQRFEQTHPNSFDVLRVKGHLALAAKEYEQAVAFFRAADAQKPFDSRVTPALVTALIADDQGAEAEKIARALIRKDKTFAPIYDVLFLYYAERGRHQDAEAILKEKIANNPKRPQYLIELATLYHWLGQRSQMTATVRRLTDNVEEFPSAHMMAGDFYLRSRYPDLALDEYQQGLRTSPSRKKEYEYRIIEGLAAQAKWDEAFRMTEEVLKEHPKDPQARAIRGALTLQRGDKGQVRSAIQDFQSALSRLPSNAVLRYRLGEAYLAIGEVQNALTQFRDAIRLQPDYLLPRYAMCRTHLARNQFTQASLVAGEILKKNPYNITARLFRAQAWFGLREYKKAREDLSAVFEHDPKNRDALYLLGRLELMEKKFNESRETFRSLSKLNPPDNRGLLGLVDLQLRTGRAASAEQLLQEQIRDTPDRLDLRQRLASVYFTERKFDQSIGELNYILSARPNDGDIHVFLGQCYFQKGDLPTAEQHFRKALDLESSNPNLYLHLGIILSIRGKLRDARPYFEQTLQRSPDNPIALNNLAFILAETTNDFDQALTLAQRALSRSPEDPGIADTLGWIYTKKNLNDDAIRLFQELLAKDPSRVSWRYHLAVALFQKGDLPRAKQELETALRHNPNKQQENQIRELLAKTS